MPAIGAIEAAALFRRLADHEAEHGPLPPKMRQKVHLLFTGFADLVRNEAVLDAVEDIIGPDILVWGTSLFIKDAGDSAFVSWHQDSTYWGLQPPDLVTAWVALSDGAGGKRGDEVHPRQPYPGGSWPTMTPSTKTTC